MFCEGGEGIEVENNTPYFWWGNLDSRRVSSTYLRNGLGKASCDSIVRRKLLFEEGWVEAGDGNVGKRGSYCWIREIYLISSKSTCENQKFLAFLSSWDLHELEDVEVPGEKLVGQQGLRLRNPYAWIERPIGRNCKADSIAVWMDWIA